jgi:hypothetical protein
MSEIAGQPHQLVPRQGENPELNESSRIFRQLNDLVLGDIKDFQRRHLGELRREKRSVGSCDHSILSQTRTTDGNSMRLFPLRFRYLKRPNVFIERSKE